MPKLTERRNDYQRSHDNDDDDDDDDAGDGSSGGGCMMCRIRASMSCQRQSAS